MNKIKNSAFFRIASLVLILTFISLDISYAYPPEHNAGSSTLAAPSLLQQQPVNEHAARFQQSIFSQGALLASVFDIGEYFFGRPEREMEPLSSRYAEEVVQAGLGKLLGDSGIEILNIVPVKHLKKTVPEKLQSALSEIGFKGTLPDEGVVFILYRKGDKKFLVQVAKKGEVSPGNLPGYEWVVSDKYVVKYVPEDYKGEIGVIARRANEGTIEPAKDVSDNVVRGSISDEDGYLKKELAKIGIKDNIAGLSFYPSRDFIQGKPLNGSLIVPGRTPEAAIELLKKARDNGIELSITGHLRGVDGAGSSLDLPEFQRKLTAIGATDLKDLPSTPTIASEFTVKVRFELAGDPEVIEYVAPDYDITESNPYRIKGKVDLTSMGRTPHGQKDAPAFIFRNIFGLKGIRIVCESISPMALAGGMESSNVFNASLIAAASMLSGADLGMAEIFSLAVKLENDEFGGLTGGQGHLCWMLGGAYRHIWLSGVKDGHGRYVNPYAVFSLPLLAQDDLTAMEEHMVIGQAGKEYVDGKAQLGRTAALVNFMWTDLLRDKDETGLPLHKEKLGLADRYVRALKEKNFTVVVDIINRYVDIRDQLCKRWTTLMLDAYQEKPVPEYAKAYADKVFNSGNSAYADYETIRKMYAQYGEGLRDVSLYAPGPIAEIIRAGRKEGMAVFPLGAGGPGANIIAISPKSTEYIRKFFESQGLRLLTEDNVRKIVRGTGMLKGYMLFKVGREPVTFDGFEAAGMKIPAPPIAAQYGQWTGKFTPMAKLAQPSKTSQLFEILESSLNNERAKFIETGNKLINALPAEPSSETAANIGTLDKKMATAEIRQRVERVIAAIESLDKEGITPEAKAAVELLKKNLNQFEADGGVASIVVLARKAKREDQKLIIGLETDWIPAINKEGSFQQNAINALMKEIDSIGEALRSMGLNNVEIIRGSGSQLADSLIKASKDSHTDMRNIVVMASKDTITSDSFKVFRDADEKDRPFLTGIDPAELIKLYEKFGELVSKQLHIKLTTLLYMTLEAAAGKEPPNAPWIQYDSVKRILILVPSAEPKDYEDLKNAYKAEAAALQSA